MANGLIHDSNGDVSSKRVSAIVCLLAAIGFGVGGVLTGNDATAYVITFISASGGFQGLTVLQGK